MGSIRVLRVLVVCAALVGLPPATAMAAEPNDDFAFATSITLPTDTADCIEPLGDLDFYSFVMPATAVVVIGFAAPADFRLALFDGRPSLIAEIQDSYRIELLANNGYYLRVSSGATGCYRLSVSLEQLPPPPPPPSDPFEPNDDFATATAVSLPATVSACIDPQSDVDLFRFSLGSSATVHARVDSDVIALALFDADRRLIAEGRPTLTADVPDGTYFLRLSSQSPGCYTLALAAEQAPPPPPPPRPQPDPFEPNDSLEAATPLVPAPSAEVTATLTLGDLDFYRFDAAADAELLVTARGTNVTALLGLFDATGRRLASGPGIRLPVATAGAYVIGVTSSGDAEFRGAQTEGTYVLSVFLFRPRIVIPGHPADFPYRDAIGPPIAADPESGAVYALTGVTLIDAGARAWDLQRLSGGRVDLLAQATPGVAKIPLGSQLFEVSSFTGLELVPGFAGADLFSLDSLGRVFAFSAAGGTPRVLADTAAGPLGGVAFARGRLFVASGLAAPAIYAVDASGAISTFPTSPAPSGFVLDLAAAPDGRSLYYTSAFGASLMQVDLASGTEIGRVTFAGGAIAIVNIAVEPSSGDVYAAVIDLTRLLSGGSSDVLLGSAVIERLDRATGQVQRFAEDLPFVADLAFGPCAEDRSSQAWCLYATTALGLMRIGGFEPAFIRDPIGDGGTGLDIRRVDARYVDTLGSGSSTHLEVVVQLAREARDGELHVLIDYGESPALGADIDLGVALVAGVPRWSGLRGIADASFVRGSELHFLAPIESLRGAATDEQKLAAAERVLLWVAGTSDRAPDTGALRFRSFYPRLTLTPATLDFGPVRVGTRAVREITVANAGIGRAALTSVQVAGLGFSLVSDPPTSLSESGSARLRVACDASRAALAEGTLHLRSQAPVGDRAASLRCAGFEFVPITFVDPDGDARGLLTGSLDVPDLLGVGYDLRGAEVVITLEFDRPVTLRSVIPPPPGATPVGGIIEFDLDRDPTTGQCFGCLFGPLGPHYAIGAGRAIFIDAAFDGRIDLGQGLVASATAIGNTLRFGIPPEYLDGGACLALGTFVQVGGFDVVDWAPNGTGTSFVVDAACGEATKGGGRPSFAGTPRWDRALDAIGRTFEAARAR